MKTTFKSSWLKKYTIILIAIYAVALPENLNAFCLTNSIAKNISNTASENNLTTVNPSINLNGKFELYFDGLDDYASEPAVINSWEEVSLMTWVKIDNASTGIQIIAGQRIFYLQLNANKSVSAFANSKTLTSKTLLNPNQWYHITITHKPNSFNLYINGQVEASRLTASTSIKRDTSSFTIGKYPDNSSNYFHGALDEFRLFNKALSSDELQKMIYQEIEDNNGIVKGSALPKNITDFDAVTNTSTPLQWESLKRYYRMDIIEDNMLFDSAKTINDNTAHAKIHNIEIINEQSAPLPFITTQSGSLETAISNLNKGISGVDALTFDWSIVNIKHNDVFYANSQKHLGLIIDNKDANLNPITYTVRNNSELNISWYLNLNGIIDLQGKSQLVQGLQSTLAPSSQGKILLNKQLEDDIYTYNYWSSPVGQTNNLTNNNNYKLTDIIKNVSFLRSGYNGTETSIADYWIWKYCNLINYDTPIWQHVRCTGTLKAGEGFTMKGTGTGTEKTLQDYKIEGKPNNGDINIPVYAGNEYLVGNPYPSPIDAQQFILDNSESNSGVTTGIIYFKEHYSGGTHSSGEFQGGYATYSLAGGIPAVWVGDNNPETTEDVLSLKTPKQYIPVGQAFFMMAETTGEINFNNGQRAFHIENNSDNTSAKSSHTKIAAEDDTRPKLRIGFNSVNQIHRQLLVTADEHATSGYDSGFDAQDIDQLSDDMYWLIGDDKFGIQAIDMIDEATKIPLGIHTKTAGVNTISIDKLENFPEGLNIYLYDKELNISHNLKEGDYNISLAAGEYLNRFEITFSEQVTLATNNFNNDNVAISYTNTENKIIVENPKSQHIETVELYNVLGQNIVEIKTETSNNHLEYKTQQLKSGIYILSVNTEFGKISKKIMVQ
ncbi:LamG-like jellyroll fold domain-containing protein [Algibacter sp. L1A34]|uniref:LamG-like jellyroll fold domain-containing protein n=1 Tax=Algibacter sp. L1A34 TaxID=2686365 RepID=UPI00131BD3BB|nr:LamG-like jellyroll fold domain-containing protein [Algibacter sp. L1A34]